MRPVVMLSWGALIGTLLFVGMLPGFLGLFVVIVATMTVASVLRKRNHKHYHHWNVQAPRYKYYRSWGAPRADWNQKEWHHEHHGFHHRWHW